MSGHWAVTVERNGEVVVAIEPNSLSGRDLLPGDEDAIRSAAMNLLGFIGEGNQPPSGVRGDPVAPSTSSDDTRDKESSSANKNCSLGTASPGLVEHAALVEDMRKWLVIDDGRAAEEAVAEWIEKLEAVLALSGAEIARPQGDCQHLLDTCVPKEELDEAEAELARLRLYVQLESPLINAIQTELAHIERWRDGESHATFDDVLIHSTPSDNRVSRAYGVLPRLLNELLAVLIPVSPAQPETK